MTRRFCFALFASMAACSGSEATPLPQADMQCASAAGLVAGDAGPGSRDRLPAPAVTLSDADCKKFAIVPEAIPVLLFHSICAGPCDPADIYGIPQTELVRIMLMLEGAGYATISIADYVQAMRSEPVSLPSRPILLTFDDGRFDAYVGADDVLRAAHARATMFVITSAAEAKNPAFMQWSEIVTAQASGRWDIQLHANAGHVKIPAGVAADGTPLLRASYANRLYDAKVYATASDHLEAAAAWKARVDGDVLGGIALLRHNVPEYVPLAFAVPFGDYGQVVSNDPVIAPHLQTLFDAQFGAWFTQLHGHPDFTTPGYTHEHARFTVFTSTTAETVYGWLSSTAKQRAALALPPK